jgi:ADP-ribose pyrophosphatase YjhB (NUDIX family)
VLVSEELIRGKLYTKWPGGGVELGEGLHDALIREFDEELGVAIMIEKHFYTTDYYVASVFDNSQIISVYYLVTTEAFNQINQLINKPIINPETKYQQVFKWIDVNTIDPNTFTLPIDKTVAQLIQQITPK